MFVFLCRFWNSIKKRKWAKIAGEKKKSSTKTKKESTHSKNPKIEKKIEKTLTKVKAIEKKTSACCQTGQALESVGENKAIDSSAESEDCPDKEDSKNENKNSCPQTEAQATLLPTTSGQTAWVHAPSKKKSHQDPANQGEATYAKIAVIGQQEVGACAKNLQITKAKAVSNDGQITSKAKSRTEANGGTGQKKN